MDPRGAGRDTAARVQPAQRSFAVLFAAALVLSAVVGPAGAAVGLDGSPGTDRSAAAAGEASTQPEADIVIESDGDEVDGDGNTGNDEDDDGDSVYATGQDASQAVSAGDRVEFSGVRHEGSDLRFFLDGTSDVTIAGRPGTVIASPDDPNVAGGLTIVEAGSVTVTDLVARGEDDSGVGLLANDVERLRVSDLVTTGWSRGVRVLDGGSAVVENVTARTSDQGLKFQDVDRATLSDARLTGNGRAVATVGVGSISVRNATLRGNDQGLFLTGSGAVRVDGVRVFDTGEAAVRASGEVVTVDGLSVDGAAVGLSVSAGSQATVANVTAVDTTLVGVRLTAKRTERNVTARQFVLRNATVRNATAPGSTSEGRFAAVRIYPGDDGSVRASDVTVTDSASVGIALNVGDSLDSGATARLDDIVVRNVGFGLSETGLSGSGLNVEGLDAVRLTNSTFAGNAGFGVLSFATGALSLSDVTLGNNGLGTGRDSGGLGVREGSVSLSGVRATGNEGPGVFLRAGATATVGGSTLARNPVGVNVTEDASATVRGSNLTANGVGVTVGPDANASETAVVRSNIVRNERFGVRNRNGSASVNATLNYWGAADGPASGEAGAADRPYVDPRTGEPADGDGDAVSGAGDTATVRFDPFLESPSGNRSTGRELVVDADGDPARVYRAIQPALDNATAGDTVTVRPGTYDPATVSTSVTLRAPDGATVTPAGSGGVAALRIEDGENTTDATVRGFTVEEFETAVEARNTAGDWTVADLTAVDTPTVVGAFATAGNWTVRNVAQRLDGSFRTGDAAGVDAADATGDWTVTGSEFASVAAGVRARDAAGDWQVVDTTVETAARGVTADGATGAWTIRGLTVHDPTDAGVTAADTAGGWTLSNTTVTGGEGDGLRAPRAGAAWVAVGLTVEDIGGTGVAAAGGGADWRLADATITAASVGVDAGSTDGAWTLSGVTVTGTTGPGVVATATTGNWTVTESEVRDTATGVDARDALGDWTVTGSDVTGAAGPGVDARRTAGAWRIRGVTNLTGNAVGVDARETTGRWAVHRTNFDNRDRGVDATDAAREGNARRNWWPDLDSIASCFGNVSCENRLGERASPTATGVLAQVFDGDADRPAEGVAVYLYERRSDPVPTADLLSAYDGREHYAASGTVAAGRGDERRSQSSIRQPAPGRKYGDGSRVTNVSTGPEGVVRLTGLDPGSYCLLRAPPGRSPRNVTATCGIDVTAGSVTTDSVTLTNDTHLENAADDFTSLESVSASAVDDRIRVAADSYRTVRDLVSESDEAVSVSDVPAIIGLALGGKAVVESSGREVVAAGVELAVDAGLFTLSKSGVLGPEGVDPERVSIPEPENDLGPQARVAKYALTVRRTEWLFQFEQVCYGGRPPQGDVSVPPPGEPVVTDRPGVAPVPTADGTPTGTAPPVGSPSEPPDVGANCGFERSGPVTGPEARLEDTDFVERNREELGSAHDAVEAYRQGEADSPTEGFQPFAVERVVDRAQRSLAGDGVVEGLVISPGGKAYRVDKAPHSLTALVATDREIDRIQRRKAISSFALNAIGLGIGVAIAVAGGGTTTAIGASVATAVVSTASSFVQSQAEAEATQALVQQHAVTAIKTLADINAVERVNNDTTAFLDEQYEDPTAGRLSGEVTAGPSFQTDDEGRSVARTDGETSLYTDVARVAAENTGNVTADARLVVASEWVASETDSRGDPTGERGASGTNPVAAVYPANDESAVELDPGESVSGRVRYALADSPTNPYRTHVVYTMLVLDGEVVDVQQTRTYVAANGDATPGPGQSVERETGPGVDRADDAGTDRADGVVEPLSTRVERAQSAVMRSDRAVYTTADADGAMTRAAFRAGRPRSATLVETTLAPGDVTNAALEPDRDADEVAVYMVAPPGADANLQVVDASGATTGWVSPGRSNATEIPGSTYTGPDATTEVVRVDDPPAALTVEAAATGRTEVPVSVFVVETPDRPPTMGVAPGHVSVSTGPNETATRSLSVFEVGRQDGIDGVSASVDELATSAGVTFPEAAVSATANATSVGPGGETSVNLSVRLPGEVGIAAEDPTRFVGSVTVASETTGAVTVPVSTLVLDTAVANATLVSANRSVTGAHLDATDASPEVPYSRVVTFDAAITGNGTVTLRLAGAEYGGNTTAYAVADGSVRPLETVADPAGLRVTAPVGDYRLVVVDTSRGPSAASRTDENVDESRDDGGSDDGPGLGPVLLVVALVTAVVAALVARRVRGGD